MKLGKKIISMCIAFVIITLSGCGHKHTWAEATCEVPKTCTECGKTEGEITGHLWTEATYAAPKTCEVCGLTEGTSIPVCVEKSSDSSTEKFTYDDKGNLIGSVEYSITKSFVYEYDSNGNKIKENDTSYEYDANGNMVVMRYKDFLDREAKTVYEYDASGNQIKEIQYSGDGTVEQENYYEYDANGNKIKMWNDFSNSTYEYDANGNMIKEIWADYLAGTWTGVTTYEYDEKGRRTKGTSTSQWGNDYSKSEAEFVYEDMEEGYILSVYSEGVLTEKYEADNKDLINKKIAYGQNGGQSVYCYEREYDADGRLTTETEMLIRSEKTYEYDTDGKLAKVIERHGDEVLDERCYEYDANGNVVKEVGAAGTITYEYDAEGKKAAGHGTGEFGTGDYSYEYDADGKLVKTSMSDSEGNVYNKTYEYDENGTLIKDKYSEMISGEGYASNWIRTEYVYAPLK